MNKQYLLTDLSRTKLDTDNHNVYGYRCKSKLQYEIYRYFNR